MKVVDGQPLPDRRRWLFVHGKRHASAQPPPGVLQCEMYAWPSMRPSSLNERGGRGSDHDRKCTSLLDRTRTARLAPARQRPSLWGSPGIFFI